MIPSPRSNAPLRPLSGFRAALLAGVALGAVAILAGPAAAQSLGPADPLNPTPSALGPPPLVGAPATAAASPAKPAAVVNDGLQPKEVYLEADLLVQDKTRKTVSGQGHVEARVDGRTLHADQVDYDTVTGVVRASGHVVIINADGTVETAQETVLDDQLRVGVATGFSARLEKNVTFVSSSAVKRNEQVTDYRNVLFTPCDICKADGVTPKTPSFAVQADRVVEDRAHAVIYFHHAIIRIKGVPVLYLPLLWTPDPTAERRSGLLAPKFSVSGRRGFSYEQPYYWAISPSADLTVEPQINSKVNPFLQAEFRERFYSGSLDIRAGYTHDQLFDSNGRYGDDTNRSYILGSGHFDLSQDWDWGFGAERVTDPTLLRRYSVPDIYEDRGPFPADTDRLISQLYTRRIDDTSMISVAAMSFQSLRAYGVDEYGRPVFEGNKPFPYVAPLIQARWDPDDPIFGGRFRLDASAVVLTRNNDVISANDPSGIAPLGPEKPGVTNLSGLASGGSALTYNDSRQADLGMEWKRDFTLPGGIRMQPYIAARGDLYGVTDGVITQPAGDGVNVVTRPADGTTARGDGTVALTTSWPLIRQGAVGGSSIILEPIVQLAYTPRQGVNPNVANEDSVAFEFDDTDLFSLHRLPGYDLYETGARANIGGRADFLWGSGHTADLTLGRVFRTDGDEVFLPQSGLRGESSDWVYGATVSPLTNLSFFLRQRLDADTLAIRRDEAGFGYSNSRFNVGIRYSYNESGLVIDNLGNSQIGRTEDLTFSGGVAITRNWQLSASLFRDLRQNVFPVSQFILTYHDECIRVDAVYTHDETYGSVIGTSDSVTLRLTLAILGDALQRASRGALR